MNTRDKLLITCVCFSIFFGTTVTASAQSTNPNNIKDDSYLYYQRCLDYLNDTIVLSMVDTLFQMGERDNDKRLCAMALCTGMDYFYLKSYKDSLMSRINKVKEYAIKNELPTYYYHAWTRVVTYYINHQYFQLAMDELDKMQTEALKDDNGRAIMLSYKLMGMVYTRLDKDKEALDCFTKARETVIDMELGDQYLFQIYNDIALTYLALGKYDLAISENEESRKYMYEDSYPFSYYEVYVRLYLALDKSVMAEDYLDSMARVITPQNNRFTYSELEVKYNMMIEKYDTAIAICNRVIGSSEDYVDKNGYLYYIAYSQEKMGQYTEAIHNYKRFYSIQDSVLHSIFTKELSEQSILFNVNELNAHKRKLELEIRTKWLVIVLLAFALLAIAFIFIIPQYLKTKKLYKDLEKANKIRSIFLQNLSHEVRTPLNSVMGFSEIIASTPELEKEEIISYSKIIVGNARMALKLFTDALEVSDANLSRDVHSGSINNVCMEIMEMSKSMVGDGVELRFEPCEGDAIEFIDHSGIVKILQNLLQNATKFTKKGTITLKTTYLDKNLFQISVTDTGIGIPASLQEKVFDMFYKVNDMSQGGGLGLYLSRRIADSMKGSVKIDKTYTDGCRVIFIFPI